MAKTREIYICRACGGTHSKWMGKCPDCGAWDALEAERIDRAASTDPQRGLAAGWAAAEMEPKEGAAVAQAAGAVAAAPLAEIGRGEGPARRATGIAELDRVLGGAEGAMGLVPGSVTLVGGAPGIGKSTLLLQAAGALARAGTRVLYVSSEESAEQIRQRAGRLGLLDKGAAVATARTGETPVPPGDSLLVLADTNLARIFEQARRTRPEAMIIDSIQMVYKADLDAAPGSISQLRRCCAELTHLAKLSGAAVLLVGHVTKDGQLAGPRLLEHLVDTVLSFDGDRYHAHRTIRAVKNRFGATDEVGLFEMTGAGLREAPEGASLAAIEGLDAPRPGTVACPVMTGSRCALAEIQALTATGFLGAAKRKCSGLDSSRLAMLIAVLEQHGGLRLADRDIFTSSAGGLRVVEPAADLALLLAIAGAHYKRSLPARTAVVGEVGLGGEVRPAPRIEMRLREAQRLGCTAVICPALRTGEAPRGLEVIAARRIGEAMDRLG
ncbi:MAG: DNA repair protein RadA [Phycisphaerales bacterium JB039]